MLSIPRYKGDWPQFRAVVRDGIVALTLICGTSSALAGNPAQHRAEATQNGKHISKAGQADTKPKAAESQEMGTIAGNRTTDQPTDKHDNEGATKWTDAAMAWAFTINLFDPQILFNDGFYDLVEVYIPEGSILKPKKPAALSCRTHLLGRIFDIMGGLLGQGAPEALNAAGFSDSELRYAIPVA